MTFRAHSAALLFSLAIMLASPGGVRAGGLVTVPTSQPDQALSMAAADAWTERQSIASLDATYRSCRRQVRRAAGIIPGKRMRLPRAYHQFIDRCVANGGIYG